MGINVCQFISSIAPLVGRVYLREWEKLKPSNRLFQELWNCLIARTHVSMDAHLASCAQISIKKMFGWIAQGL
jgi:hypothetical protein